MVSTKSLAECTENTKWIIKNFETLKKFYNGKHVAVKARIVIDSDENEQILIGRLRKEYPNKDAYLEIARDYIGDRVPTYPSYISRS